MEISNISWVGVIVATVAAFIVGGAYYGALAKPWMKAARIDPSDTKMSVSLFAVSLVCEFVMAIVLSVVVGATGGASIAGAMTVSIVLWLGFVVTTQMVNHRYQGYGWDLTLIDCGHWLLVFLAQGAVVGYFNSP